MFFGDDRHLSLNAIDFAQADLVNFVRGQMRGGPAVDVVLVAPLAIGQGSDGQRGAAPRRVVGAHEIGELAVGRQHTGIDCVGNFLGQTLLIFSGNVGGILLGGQQKRIGVDDALALHRNFFQQEAHRHQLVFHASAQDFGGLIQHARNLVQARDVILVMLHRIERDRERQIGQVGVDAVHLIDRHFEFFQIVIGVAQFEHAHQQIVGELILFGHAGGGDRGDLGQEIAIGLVAVGERGQRTFGEFVVVAIIAESRGALRRIAQIGLVLIFEDGVLGRDAIGDGGRRLAGK